MEVGYSWKRTGEDIEVCSVGPLDSGVSLQCTLHCAPKSGTGVKSLGDIFG